jgi:ribulose-phosphate 3-epimerase
MCGDLANLERTLADLAEADIDAIHLDVLDGAFSPSLPLGLETVRRVRQLTKLPLDAHVMSVNNEYFISQMLDVGVDSVTFHYETSLHVDRQINLIRQAGAAAAVALNPATSLSVLEFILDQADMICLMLINPGYATLPGEKRVPYALAKIARLRQLIRSNGLHTAIQVDGRVSLDAITALVEAGASNLVLGSTSLFLPGRGLTENAAEVRRAANLGSAWASTGGPGQ